MGIRRNTPLCRNCSTNQECPWGRFPYAPKDAVDGVYTIPLVDFSGVTTLYIAAQAEVTNPTEIDPVTLLPREESVWAEGDEIRPGKNWAMYFEFDLVD